MRILPSISDSLRVFFLGFVLALIPTTGASCHDGGAPDNGQQFSGGFTNQKVDGIGVVSVTDSAGTDKFVITYNEASGNYSGSLAVAYVSGTPDGYLIAKVVDETGNSVGAGTSANATALNVSVSNSSLTGALGEDEDWYLEIWLIMTNPSKEVLLCRVQIHDG